LEVSDQLDAPAALPPRKESPAPIEKEADDLQGRTWLDAHIPFTPRFPKCSPSFRIFNRVLNAFLDSHMRATCSSYLVILDLVALIICGEEYKLWSS
jgi:hypothetical protein